MRYTSTFATALFAVMVAVNGCSEVDSQDAQLSLEPLISGSGEATVTSSTWFGAYCVNGTVKNNGSAAITNWTVVLTTSPTTAAQIYSSWNGTFTPSGTQVTVKAVSSNANIPAGGNATFGFCARATGTPISPTVTSLTVVGGGTSGQTGTIGGPGGADKDFQRVKVSVGAGSYIIQNNNYGNPSGTDQTLSYNANSFTITQATGTSSGAVPASFPNIYIGANGNTANGFTTHPGDGLPKTISSMSSAQTTLRYSSCSGRGYNAVVDAWLSFRVPSAQYTDAISGEVLVWLCKPAEYQPIGTVRATATIAGTNWTVWVGPRGTGSGSSIPVVTYVANANTTSRTFDLKAFLNNAAQYGISSSWYVTDVFGGFEIWNGPSTANLTLNEFSCAVR